MINGWWHAGEEEMLAKYENRNVADIVLQMIFVLALWLLLPQQYRIIAILVSMTYVPYVVAERRIAIIFTSEAVVYRPMLRAPQRIKFEHILEIRRVSVRRFVAGTFSGLVPGVALRVLGGETVVWRLYVRDPDDVLQQLQRKTGKVLK